MSGRRFRSASLASIIDFEPLDQPDSARSRPGPVAVRGEAAPDRIVTDHRPCASEKSPGVFLLKASSGEAPSPRRVTFTSCSCGTLRDRIEKINAPAIQRASLWTSEGLQRPISTQTTDGIAFTAIDERERRVPLGIVETSQLNIAGRRDTTTDCRS
jgi:hypothetical protein